MLKSPVLLESELDAVRNDSALQAQTFSLHYREGSPNAMKEALDALCKQVGGRADRVDTPHVACWQAAGGPAGAWSLGLGACLAPWPAQRRG